VSSTLLRDEAAPLEFAEAFEEIAAKITLVDSSRDFLRAPGNVIFEGAQGVLLDEQHGFHPHTTWSTTTFANALQLLRESNYPGTVRRLGALRTYMTRHGAGPFPTETRALEPFLPDFHNAVNHWQQNFRVGWLDIPLLRYALDVVGGTDALAVTCVDRLAALPDWQFCTQYRGLPSRFLTGTRLKIPPRKDLQYQAALGRALQQADPIYEQAVPSEIVEQLSTYLNSPIDIISQGPTWRDKMSSYPQKYRQCGMINWRDLKRLNLFFRKIAPPHCTCATIWTITTYK
jgi:adenylosuccinate synthase